MICCCQHGSLIAILFEPLTSKHSYHCRIDQKTSVHAQKTSSSPGKFNGMLYLFLLYTLLSCRDVYFVVWSTSFVAKCIQDVAFIVKAHHLEHWLWEQIQEVAIKVFFSWPQHYTGLVWRMPCILLWPWFALGCNLSNKEHILRPYLVEVHGVIKTSNKGHILGPHLVEVRLGHIWLKSAVW